MESEQKKVWIVIPTAMVKITDSGSVMEELLPVTVLDTYDSLIEYLRKEYDVSDDNVLSIKESFELYPAVAFPKSLKTPKFYKDLEIKWYRIEIYEATVIK